MASDAGDILRPMPRRGLIVAAAVLVSLPLHAQPADVVVTGARVYTLEPAQPWAEVQPYHAS
jgi:hypothetical protein